MAHACNPTLRRQGQVAPWGSPNAHPSLCDKLRWNMEQGLCWINDTKGFLLASTRMHMCVHPRTHPRGPGISSEPILLFTKRSLQKMKGHTMGISSEIQSLGNQRLVGIC